MTISEPNVVRTHNEAAPDEPVRVHVADDILTISLNRPKRHNAVNNAMHVGLVSALTQAAADESIRVVLLRGEGRSFCSGGDVELFDDFGGAAARSLAQQVLTFGESRQLLDVIMAVPQPI